MAKQNKADRQARLRAVPDAPEAKPPTRDELYAEAKAAGLAVTSRMKRDEIVAVLTASGTEEVEVAPPDPDTIEGRKVLGDERVAEAAAHYAETALDPDAPKPEENEVKRLKLAKEEQVALKAWQLAGCKGDRPVTPNYDHLAAAYVNGGSAPKAKRKRAGGGATRAKSGGPRRVEAEAAKAALGGKRGAGVKISDDDLRTYIRDVHAEHPESSRSDEREYAYWVEKLSLTGRWPAFWAEVVEGEAPATPEPDEQMAAQVTGAVKKAVAKKAPATKKSTPAKRAPAKKAAGASKEVTPRFKQTKTK